jgi:hypothetical protein
LQTDGTLTVLDKPVPFSITISDFMNNQSIIKGELLSDVENQLDILNSVRKDSSVYIKVKVPPIKALKLYSKISGRKWSAVNYFEIVEGSLNDPEEAKLLKINIEDSSLQALKIEVNNKYERVISLTGADREKGLENSFICLGDKIIGEFSGKYKNPRIQMSNRQIRVSNNITDEDRLQVILPAESVVDDKVIFMLDDIYGNTDSLELDYHILLPGERNSISWFDSSLVIASNPKSVTDTTLVTAVKHEQDSTGLGIPAASQIYEIKPDNFHIFESVTISVQADSIPDWGHWSVFKINGKDKFQYLPAILDSNTMRFTAKTSSFGKFIVAADTIPPDLLIESPRSGKVYNSTPKIKVFLKDSISGIGNEDHISLSVNGNYVLPEWDPEEDFIIGILEKDLPRGNHTFSASVRDRSGNITRQAVYFKIQ